MLVSGKVRKVVVHLDDGKTLEYDGKGSVVEISTPIGGVRPAAKQWADGSAPRIDQVMVTVMTRDDR